jgi:Rha family phage regulatory protein
MKDLVQMIDGKAVTTSRKVAEIFEKQHKDILRAIRDLEIPGDYRERNFAPTVYEQPNPSGGKPIQQPEYLITRDGFTLLAMGFTGKRAMQFKIAYIEAFNEMEKALSGLGCTTAIPHRRPANIAVSTADLIEKINLQLLAGMEVEPEVLRYAWNIGRLVGKTMRKQNYPADLEDFIMGLASGEYTRGEVYDMYCSQCNCPMSARRFWPVALTIRPCSEKRTAQARKVIFQ